MNSNPFQQPPDAGQLFLSHNLTLVASRPAQTNAVECKERTIELLCELKNPFDQPPDPNQLFISSNFGLVAEAPAVRTTRSNQALKQKKRGNPFHQLPDADQGCLLLSQVSGLVVAKRLDVELFGKKTVKDMG